jgi:hypothetical protein
MAAGCRQATRTLSTNFSPPRSRTPAHAEEDRFIDETRFSLLDALRIVRSAEAFPTYIGLNSVEQFHRTPARLKSSDLAQQAGVIPRINTFRTFDWSGANDHTARLSERPPTTDPRFRPDAPAGRFFFTGISEATSTSWLWLLGRSAGIQDITSLQFSHGHRIPVKPLAFFGALICIGAVASSYRRYRWRNRICRHWCNGWYRWLSLACEG